MARTRGELKTLIKAHTGWTDRSDKDSLIDSLCDSALKYAIMEHDFRDITTVTSGEAEITTLATSVDLSTLTPTVYKIITARLLRVDNSTEQGYPLPLRNRKWWDKFIIDPTNNTSGVPSQALRVKNVLHFDRPIEDDWKLRLRYSSLNTYTDDSTETPSELLDLFVEYKVTADVFFSDEDMEKFALWNRRAIGNNPEFPGGELGRAIRADDREAAKEMVLTRPWELVESMYPFAITTNDLNWSPTSPHSQFRVWR
jgi:hypothetical protein